jgi:hypothetical protein
LTETIMPLDEVLASAWTDLRYKTAQAQQEPAHQHM